MISLVCYLEHESLYFNICEHVGPKVCIVTFSKKVPVAGTFVGNVKVEMWAGLFGGNMKVQNWGPTCSQMLKYKLWAGTFRSTRYLSHDAACPNETTMVLEAPDGR